MKPHFIHRAISALLVAALVVCSSQDGRAANSFYNASGTPAQGSALSSSAMRGEFASIGAGFDKMPALVAGTAIIVNPGATALTNTIGTLALAGNFATTGAFNTTFIQSANVSLTLPGASDTLVGRATTDTLTNKSISGTTNTLTNIGNAALTNSSITIGSSAVSLGGTLSTINGNLTFGGSNAYGTPASITLTNGSGLPISSGVSGLGTGVGTFLATPSSANLLTALTTKTGTGSAVFGTAPAISAPVISGHATIEGVTPTGATGTGNLVFSASPTFTGTIGAGALSMSGNITTSGSAAINTTVGGWLGNALLEGRSGQVGGGAVSAYNLATGGWAFLGRVDATASLFMNFNYGNTLYVGSISTDGSSVSYNTSSDARLKTNVTDAPSAGAIIDALQVRSWDWKHNGAHEIYGFVAQEEVNVAPFAVHVGDSDPNVITREWGRDDSKLVPLLVKEVQSLRARVAALEATVH